MDSGNSGSMQSSSTGGGGDEEYDSRGESSISAFLNNPPPPLPQSSLGTFTATATNHPIPQHHLHPRIFDPLSNYLDPTQRSHPNSSLLNLDMVWSKAARSEPNPSHLGGLIPCSISSSTQNQQAFLSSQLVGQARGAGVAAFPTTHHSLQPPPETAASRGGLLLSDDQAHNNTTNNNNNNANTNMVRNPKKRSRASRRAPTTVLTTDTTNFRAMVQEFTGIPAPPFTSSSFPRTRLDLFGSPPTSSTIRSLDPPQPPYLLRPFPQKLQHHFPPSTTSIPSMMDTFASNHSTNSLTNSTSINYQLSSSSSADHLGLLKQHQPLNVMNNMHGSPILSFQSILQAPPAKYTLENSSTLLAASKTKDSLEIPPSAVDSHLKMGVLEELGLSHAHVNAHVSGLHHNMVSSSSSDGALLSRVNNNMRNPSSADWAQRMGSITNNDGDHGGVLRSSSDFHGEKAPECGVVARSEGMVESWINCSSD